MEVILSAEFIQFNVEGKFVKFIDLRFVFFAVVLIAGCSSNLEIKQTNLSLTPDELKIYCTDKKLKKRRINFVADAIDRLLMANRCFEKAHEANDGVEMTRAALMRFDVSMRNLSKNIDVQLTMKTIKLLRQARVVAGDDKEAQAAIDKLIKDAELGPDTELAAESSNIIGGRFGQFLGISGTKHSDTYTLRAREIKTVALPVKASKGAIIYIEAPRLRGVVLTVLNRGKNIVTICRDSSPHGILICRWRPKKDGFVKITIENTGNTAAPVLMITNQ